MGSVKSPRVGYVVKAFPRLSETFVLNEVLELVRRGTAVQIYSLHDPKLDGRAGISHGMLRELEVPVTYLPSRTGLKHRIKQGRYRQGHFLRKDWVEVSDGTEEHLFASLRGAMLAVLAKAQGVEHLHAHFGHSPATAAMVASGLTGIPFSFTAHAKDIYHESMDRTLLAQKILAARFVVTVSEYNRRHLESLVVPGTGRIIVLYNGVDLARVAPDPRIRRRPGLILAAGRLVEKKGFFYLVQACRLLQERGVSFQCHIVGEGPEQEKLAQEIEALRVARRVRLLGAMAQEKLHEIMMRATLFVLPCVISATGDRDALPTVLLEALALELPAISTNLSGIPEIIENGKTGFLVPPGDPVPLACAIEELLAKPGLRERLARQGRQRAKETFDLQKNVGRLRALFTGEADSGV